MAVIETHRDFDLDPKRGEADGAKPAQGFEVGESLSAESNTVSASHAGTDEGSGNPIDLVAIAKLVPDRMAFKIGDVAEIADVKPYVLRYWESEFEALSPKKSAFNQRMYTKRDVETVLLIKKLLYDEKFSIAGAKRKLSELRRELKTEKTRVEVIDRVDRAVAQFSEIIEEIARLKEAFR